MVQWSGVREDLKGARKDKFVHCPDYGDGLQVSTISKLIKWYSLCVVYNMTIIAQFFKETF